MDTVCKASNAAATSKDTGEEDSRDADFLARGKLQFPDGEDGEDEEKDVGGGVDGAGYDQHRQLVDAMSGNPRIPDFRDRVALEDSHKEVDCIEDKLSRRAG